MLESINRVFQHSGVDPSTVPIRHQDWAENMRKRLEALEWPKAYAFLYRQNSHAIHGTWVDLLMNHLDDIGPSVAGGPAESGASRRHLQPVPPRTRLMKASISERQSPGRSVYFTTFTPKRSDGTSTSPLTSNNVFRRPRRDQNQPYSSSTF